MCPMNPRLLRPTTSAAFPLAEARDSSNNVIFGTDFTDGDGVKWRAHIFEDSGTLTFTKGGQVEYLVVGGGGHGGYNHGSGGGAGGFREGDLIAAPQSYAVTVGAGGPTHNSTAAPSNGQDSIFASITSAGGGSSAASSASGNAGGSGAGSAAGSRAGGAGNTPSASPPQGNNGGAGSPGDGQQRHGGGGGGAGAVGQDATDSQAGDGGIGKASSISGSSVMYAGGGGGGGFTGTNAPGGDGGGGRGSAAIQGLAGLAGTNNSGGGGGGGSFGNGNGGAGGSGIVIVRYRRALAGNAEDPDAALYLSKVQSADGQALEPAVQQAINDFVVGCKADGIWNAIKASCILMGARTLAGALTPLKGGSPTNVSNNFVSGDYSRTTGLVGNGTNKFLNSGRNTNADPQDNQHNAVYVSTAQTSGTAFYLGARNTTLADGTIGAASLGTTSGNHFVRSRSETFITLSGTPAGLVAVSRSASSEYISRNGGVSATQTVTSQTPANREIALFALMQSSNSTGTLFTTGRLAFYSIGESLDLALLDTRVTRLYEETRFAINTGVSGSGYDIDTLRYINAGYAAGGSLA
jgi:hypothetical protein